MDIAKLNPKEYEEIIWSRPENNRQASQLVVLGGSRDHFAITSRYYMSLSDIKGIKLSLILPDYLSKLVGNKDPNIIFVNSHKTGGYYTKESVTEVNKIIAKSDACLIAGEMGHSNETQQFIENVIGDLNTQIVLTNSALNCFADNYLPKILSEQNITLCLNNAELLSLGKKIKFEKAFTSSLGFVQKIDYLKSFTKKYSCALVISDTNTDWCAKNEDVFYSKLPKDPDQITSDISQWLSWNNKDPLKTIVSTFIDF